MIDEESACSANANLCAPVCQTTLLTPEVTSAVTERHQGSATMFSLMFPTKKHEIMRLLLLPCNTNAPVWSVAVAVTQRQTLLTAIRHTISATKRPKNTSTLFQNHKCGSNLFFFAILLWMCVLEKNVACVSSIMDMVENNCSQFLWKMHLLVETSKIKEVKVSIEKVKRPHH